MQLKRIEFSSKLDVQVHSFFRFVLNALDRQNVDVEISVDYGVSLNNPDIITANVWARIADGTIKNYLYTETIAQAVVNECGYAEIAKKIHNNPVFQDALKSFLDCAYQNLIQ